jgi:hypothetical protein
MTSARPHPWRRRLLLLGAGLLAALVAGEAALWIVYWTSRPALRGVLGEGSRTILCIGDSNTFGVHLTSEESYPGQLQTFLDRAPESPWRVVNVGWPGLNSAQVRRNLPDQLREYRPELVICWVGTNNTWSDSAGQLWETPDRETPESLAARVLHNVRILRVARMLINRWAGDEAESKVMTPERVRESLEIDLHRIRALCDEAGARLMLADYPIHFERTEREVNAVLHEIAEDTDTPLVRLHDRLLPVVYGLGYDRTMFEDYHANRWGNHEVARLMLLGAIGAGLLEPRPEWLAVPPVQDVVPDWPIVVLEGDAERARVRLRGPAGSPYRVVLGRRYTREGNKTVSVTVKYKDQQQWSREELERRGYVGRLGPDGQAEVELLLPPEPEHPSPGTGARVQWLGWDLSVGFDEGEGLVMKPDKHRVLVLLDPAVVGGEG